MIRVKKFTKNTKVWDSMKRNLKSDKSAIRIGWFDGQRYGPENGGLPMAQVAQWVEEGQRWQNQPPRPAIRTRFIPALAESGELLSEAIPLVQQIALGKMTWKKLHEKLAPKLLYKFKIAIETLQTPPNKPSTVAKKGFNNPWVDTGSLVSSARYKVVAYSFRNKGA